MIIELDIRIGIILSDACKVNDKAGEERREGR